MTRVEVRGRPEPLDPENTHERRFLHPSSLQPKADPNKTGKRKDRTQKTKNKNGHVRTKETDVTVYRLGIVSC